MSSRFGVVKVRQVEKEVIMKRFSAVLFILLLVSFAHAQQTWTKTYGGTNWDEGYSVQQTSDGGYILTGYTASFGGTGSRDLWLLKTDALGDTLWTKTYGGDYDEEGWSVQQTADSGYIVAGETWSSGTGYADVYLIKTNASGDTLWTKTYGGPNDDWSYSVRQTSDGGYILAGYTWSFGAGSGDVWLLKTDASGDTLWTKTYGGPNNDCSYSVQQTSDGGYILTGVTYSFGASTWDVWLIKTNASGGTLWTKTYGGTYDDEGYSVQQTSDGGYILTGFTCSFGDTVNGNVYLVKTDASGDTLWTRTYGGTNSDWGYSVQQTSDGGYIIAGYTESFGAGGSDVYLIKTDASGDTLWTRTFGGTSDDYGRSVQQTADGGYIITGYTLSFGAGGYDVYLIKTDSLGRGSGVEERTDGSRQKAVGGIKANPNPFVSYATVPGHKGDRFRLYDVSGRKVGTYKGDCIGENAPPGVYFLRLEGKNVKPIRIVKLR